MKLSVKCRAIGLPILLLVTACLPRPGLQASVTETDQQAVSACREAFPETLRNPGAAGGWLLRKDRERLCLYGTLAKVDVAGLRAALQDPDNPVTRVVVRSAGGPVDTWLEMAEALGMRQPALVVDEACFSSCAVYALPPVSKVTLSGPGLIVWHGGPNIRSRSEDFGIQAPSYAEIAARTERLYRKFGLSTKLLSDTLRTPSDDQVRMVIRMAPGASEISEYAVSAETVQSCYGVESVRGISHPGSDAQVLAEGLRFSPMLAVLEFPQGVEPCN